MVSVVFEGFDLNQNSLNDVLNEAFRLANKKICDGATEKYIIQVNQKLNESELFCLINQ